MTAACYTATCRYSWAKGTGERAATQTNVQHAPHNRDCIRGGAMIPDETLSAVLTVIKLPNWGTATVVWQIKPLLMTPGTHMGTNSSLSCFIPDPAPC